MKFQVRTASSFVNRAYQECDKIGAKEGKLTIVSADGFRLAVTSLDYDDGEGQIRRYQGDRLLDKFCLVFSEVGFR